MATTAGHSPVAGLFKCNLSNICTACYTISTDSVLARFFCNSRASCFISQCNLPVNEASLKVLHNEERSENGPQDSGQRGHFTPSRTVSATVRAIKVQSTDALAQIYGRT